MSNILESIKETKAGFYGKKIPTETVVWSLLEHSQDIVLKIETLSEKGDSNYKDIKNLLKKLNGETQVINTILQEVTNKNDKKLKDIDEKLKNQSFINKVVFSISGFVMTTGGGWLLVYLLSTYAPLLFRTPVISYILLILIIG